MLLGKHHGPDFQEGFVSQVLLFHCSPGPGQDVCQGGTCPVLFCSRVRASFQRDELGCQLWLYFGAAADLPHSPKICAKTADKAVAGFQLPKANRPGESCGKMSLFSERASRNGVSGYCNWIRYLAALGALSEDRRYHWYGGLQNLFL